MRSLPDGGSGPSRPSRAASSDGKLASTLSRAERLVRERPSARAVFFDVDFTLIFPGPTFQGEGYARFCDEQGITVECSRFEEAVAAASFILDDVEDPIYDAALFVHYTASIIEHMGGRGSAVVRVAERIYEAVGGQPPLRDVRRRGAGAHSSGRSRPDAGRDLELASQPRRRSRSISSSTR